MDCPGTLDDDYQDYLRRAKEENVHPMEIMDYLNWRETTEELNRLSAEWDEIYKVYYNPYEDVFMPLDVQAHEISLVKEIEWIELLLLV